MGGSKNDPVYEKLQVWSKDASGADQLLNLKQAQVSAVPDECRQPPLQ